MMKILTAILATAVLAAASGCEKSSSGVQDDKWSIRMANSALERHDSLIYYNNPSKVKWQYDIAMVGHAIDKLGAEDKRFSEYMEGFYNYFLQEDGQVKKYKMTDYNLDHINPAKGLITLYKRTGEEKYKKAIAMFIKQLENQPKTEAGGFWHKKIYEWQMWLDGLYMSAPFMAQYAQEFSEPQWFDVAARQIKLVYNKTYDPNTGLLYHAWDESRSQRWANPETGQSKHFWGRAIGWYMMALVDALDYFPQDHPERRDIIEILNNVSEALLKVRDKETGLWYQVLDQGGREGNYLEASCSNMFTYAFAKGARKGYLSKEYLKIANDSFDSILEEFIVVEPDGKITLTSVCGAAGLGGNPYRDGSYEYYISEKKVDNDPKGVGPFIMAAIELDR